MAVKPRTKTYEWLGALKLLQKRDIAGDPWAYLKDSGRQSGSCG